MEDTNRVYRIRTTVGEDAPNVIHVPLKQSYDMFEILSLKLNQANTYKTYESDYGVIVGRVTANGGFGVPNAKVSIFIEVSDDESLKNRLLYNFTSTSDKDNDGIRYNLLPDFVDDACHQNVGTFPNKRLVLDNQDVIDMFDKYWKYTTTTNHAGDYMLFGIPTGSQQLHVDVDLSDCGILSQRPRDMIEKGYNANMFESPNKFKSSTNLNSLAQIISQDRGVYVYPYWGDVSDGDDKFSITRCDINLEYKFESYAVFMGSIVTDKGSNAIGKNCTGTEQNGKMSDLIAGEGTIEMIRKTIDGRVEEYPIMGNRLIDGDGVWCYQIPMNLDYVTTDEFGNLVPTDNPEKGIATRTRVRFRISLDENPSDAAARKRARYLVPNNPRLGEGDFDDTMDADYEFGSATREESYCDMFWNKVYTVKNYIPKIQKNSKDTNRKHTGIKLVNHYGDNNPMPYNSLMVKLTFTYRVICVITKVVINLIEFVNQLLSIVSAILCLVIKILELPSNLFRKIGNIGCFKVFGARICPLKLVAEPLAKLWDFLITPLKWLIQQIIPNCIGLSSEFCDDGINQVTYYPGCGYFLFKLFKLSSIGLDCIWEGDGGTKQNHINNQLKICENEHKSPEDCEMSLTEPSNATAMLYNCIENQLAQQNDVTSFNFHNDWINGVLYAPLWYRKIRKKKSYFFGLIRKKAKDDWCSAERNYPGMRLIQYCTVNRDVDGTYDNFDGENVEYRRVIDFDCKDNKCHKKYTEKKGMKGVIVPKQTMLNDTVYYYKAVEYDESLPKNPLYKGEKAGDIKLMFATDIVLLGSLNDCDLNGVPQFFKSIESTTYNMPTDILFTDYDFILTVNEETGESERLKYDIEGVLKTAEMAGCDWGNPNEFDKYDGGLFYSIGCAAGSTKLDVRSCINLSRICEYGVSLDETKEVADLANLQNARDEEINVDVKYFQKLITDGFISWDELYNLDERSMFATMNGNRLQTRLNERNGLYEYDFRYLYPENFDGSLKKKMEDTTSRYSDDINYKNNYKLEEKSRDYYIFRMGNQPYYYDKDYSFPRYENSFYFYFGLKAGKTALEKFNSKYFAECVNPISESQIGIKYKANSWCVNNASENDGYLALDLSRVSTPYSLLINGVSDSSKSYEFTDIEDEKVIFINEGVEVPSNLSDYARIDNMIDNGAYQATLTDNEGAITEFTFNILGAYLTFKTNVNSFEQPNNTLMEIFGNNYEAIAADDEDIHDEGSEKKDYNRKIGGVVTVYDIFMNGEKLENYKIELIPNGNINGYNGVTLKYNNGNVSIEGVVDSILNDDYTSTQHYAFGLPKGDTEYTVRITQLCNGIDSANAVSNEFYVSEPVPYKMYINDIDYDVIKNFDNYTGWNMSGTLSSPNLSEGSVTMDNPWFKADNIYYGEIVSGYSNDSIVSFSVNKDENKYFVLMDDGTTHEISIDTIKQEFGGNTQTSNTVPYNWVGRYIADADTIKWNDANDVYERIDDYILKVNTVLSLRREMRDMVKTTFFMNCEGDAKTILVTGKTSNLPCTKTIVYHPEKAVEFEDYNVLDGTSLRDEDIDTVNDIRIPTISYKSSERYGDGTDSDVPCLASVDGNKKKPYSCGIMNYSGMSIPKKSDGKPFDNVENGSARYINHSSTQIADMFNFPIIDNIMRLDSIAWSAFVRMAKYGYDGDTPRKDVVTMNGLISGVVYNGNISGDSFEVQTLNDLKIKLSDNIADESTTYVKKRVINGYDYDQVGNWALSVFKSYINGGITEEVVSTLNNVLETNIFTADTVRNIVNSLSVENGSIMYNGNTLVEVSAILGKILSFTNYVVDNRADGTQQYSFVLPVQNTLQIQDANYCGVEMLVDGELDVELDETSVNDCRENGEKILRVVTNEGSVYSIFKTDENGNGYPLNLADSSTGLVWQIDEQINGLYNASSAPQNLFSFQMKSKYLRGDDNLVDTSFISQTLVSGDSEEEVYETTKGYGTNGEFIPDGSFSYPVFIVSENEDRVRALSPVYDFSDVFGIMKYGILERIDVEETVDETTGEIVYNVLEPTNDYKFGIAVKEGHFYLDNYEYKLSGVCEIDSLNKIEIAEQTLNGSEKYVFSSITENTYNLLKSKFVMYGPIMSGQLKQIIENTQITAIDYTGLRHICGFKSEDLQNAETKWVTYIWKANMPKDDNGNRYPANVENGGIKYGEDIYEQLEFNYEEGDEIEPMKGVKGNTLGIDFLGWSENKPDKTALVDFTNVENKIANGSKVYFGNWDVSEPEPPAPETFTVKFLDEDGNEITSLTKTVEKGQTIEKPSGEYADRIWYLNGEEATEWPYTVNGEMTFTLGNMFIVNWYDDDTNIIGAPTFNVVFKKEDGGQILIEQEVVAGESVTLDGIAINYEWYVEGDSGKNYVDFPYIVNDNIVFIGILKDVETTIFRSLSPTQYTVSYEPTTIDVVIETVVNGNLRDFNVVSSTTWLGYIKSSQHDEFDRTITFTITIERNDATGKGSRTGYLTLTQIDSTLPTIRIMVTQNNKNEDESTISMSWKIINNRTVGLPIESIHVYFRNDISIQMSSGGGVPLEGGVREGTSTISSNLKNEELICERIELAPPGGYPDCNFTQSPNPYVWNTNGQGGNNPLVITITNK